MKKLWSAPAAEVVQFAANEYCWNPACWNGGQQIINSTYTTVGSGYIMFDLGNPGSAFVNPNASGNIDGSASNPYNKEGGERGSYKYYQYFTKTINQSNPQSVACDFWYAFGTTTAEDGSTEIDWIFDPCTDAGSVHSPASEPTYAGWWKSANGDKNSNSGWTAVDLWWEGGDSEGGRLHAATVVSEIARS